MKISPEQCRMARAALQLGIRELAKLAHVSASTIARFEANDQTVKQRTRDAIQRALEAAGVEFTDGGAPGVQLRHPRSQSLMGRTRSEPSESKGRGPGAADTIEIAGAVVGHCCHVCGFFASRQEEYEVLLPFLRDGIAAGQRIVQIVDPARHAERARLVLRGDVENGAAGQDDAAGYKTLRWQDAYLAPGWFDQYGMLDMIRELERCHDRQAPWPTRVWANMEWALEKLPGVQDLVEYESRLNNLLPECSMAVVCSYDLTQFSATVITDVLRAHPYVVLGGVLRENPHYVPPDRLLPELHRRRGTTR